MLDLRSSLQRAEAISRLVNRVLIADSNIVSARLISDITRGLGARDIVIERNNKRALQSLVDLSPTIIFVEFEGSDIDACCLSKQLRRSTIACRKVPVVTVSASDDPLHISRARDAGINRIMRRPFSNGDVIEKLDHVLRDKSDWIESINYVGPDRRNSPTKGYKGPLRRRKDASGKRLMSERKSKAIRELSSAIDTFELNPKASLRLIVEEALTLKTLAIKAADFDCSLAAAEVIMIASRASADRNGLAEPVARLISFALPGPES